MPFISKMRKVLPHRELGGVYNAGTCVFRGGGGGYHLPVMAAVNSGNPNRKSLWTSRENNFRAEKVDAHRQVLLPLCLCTSCLISWASGYLSCNRNNKTYFVEFLSGFRGVFCHRSWRFTWDRGNTEKCQEFRTFFPMGPVLLFYFICIDFM